MFPNMPPEVFDTFLVPLINDIGWPFLSTNTPLNGTDWLRILSPLTLVDLSQLKWVRHVFPFDDSLFYPDSLADIELIIQNKTSDVWAFVGRDSTPCRNSLLWHEARALETRRLCTPITIARTNFGMKLLDGNHRIAALITTGLIHEIPIDAWIGEP